MQKDPKRIKRILELIKKVWIENPELRLCQLIGNNFSVKDLYYIEDSELEKILEQNISELCK